MDSYDGKTIDKAISSKNKTVILFWADWCPYCRKFKPIFDSYNAPEGVSFAESKINEDENPLWDRFAIEAVPTIIAFQNGKQLAKKTAQLYIGLTEADLKEFLGKIQ